MNATEQIKAIQRVLFPDSPREWDGRPGPKWNKALAALETDADFPATPIPDPAQTGNGGAVDARSMGSIRTLDFIVQPLAVKFILTLAAQGIDARIIDGSRTHEQQNELYAQGRTKPGNIVTNARGGQSWHCFAVAFDIGIFQGGKYLGDSPLYEKAGPIGESLGFEWGGRWKSPVDFPHYQYNPNHVSLAEARVLHDQGKSIFG